MKMNKKGFTLIEMLVVIAIIAILVAIIIPTVSSATEKAKEAKDAANIRSAVAECTIALLGGENSGNATYDSTTNTASADVTLTQTDAFNKIVKSGETLDIGGFKPGSTQYAAGDYTVTVAADGTVTVAAKTSSTPSSPTTTG